MKKFTGILMVFCLVAGFSGCQKNILTIVQYNVGVFDKYAESGFDAVASALKEVNADVVTLNEVDSCAVRTGAIDQMSEFAWTMGDWGYHYASAMPFQGGAYGVGVAYSPKLKALRSDKVALPRVDGREPRAVAVVEFEDFVLCSTHLDLTLESQLEQIRTINHYVDSVYADYGKPVFLGGDFNSTPDSEPVTLLKETWTLLTPDSPSYPSHAPRGCIDYIFVRPNGKEVTVVSAQIPQTLQTADLATASDHLPVVLTVKVK
jgi:endonuclease/exonuclease/phosphatase family metal-dependent hydrolase